jgi:anti-sigma regulatory factor (Ser/Thr protein kinase)
MLGLGGMTSRQASDEASLGEAVVPTCPAELPEWLGGALNRLSEGRDGPTYSLQPEPESVTEARHFAAAALRKWGLSALTDDVALVVSELVTNALRHSLPPHPGHSRTGLIRLHLLTPTPEASAYLLAGVVDSGTEAPRRRVPDFVAETGRGLHIVESFSRRWGWTPLRGGKIVWALFGPPLPA